MQSSPKVEELVGFQVWFHTKAGIQARRRVSTNHLWPESLVVQCKTLTAVTFRSYSDDDNTENISQTKRRWFNNRRHRNAKRSWRGSSNFDFNDESRSRLTFFVGIQVSVMLLPAWFNIVPHVYSEEISVSSNSTISITFNIHFSCSAIYLSRNTNSIVGSSGRSVASSSSVFVPLFLLTFVCLFEV